MLPFSVSCALFGWASVCSLLCLAWCTLITALRMTVTVLAQLRAVSMCVHSLQTTFKLCSFLCTLIIHQSVKGWPSHTPVQNMDPYNVHVHYESPTICRILYWLVSYLFLPGSAETTSKLHSPLSCWWEKKHWKTLRNTGENIMGWSTQGTDIEFITIVLFHVHVRTYYVRITSQSKEFHASLVPQWHTDLLHLPNILKSTHHSI